MWLGDFNFEEELGPAEAAASIDGACNARGAMLDAYAAVCKKLGSDAAGGLQDAYRVTHPQGGATSRQHRCIDRALIDPRLIGELPGLVDASYVHRRELQVTGARGKLKDPPDHNAVGFTLRFSDTPRPLPCPRYDPTSLSPARKKMVETVILSLLSDASSDPERTEGHIQSRVSALFDDFRKEDRRRRQDERHTLISKLDACERSMRQQGNDGAHVAAMRAQIHRHTLKLQRLMMQIALAQGRSRQRQRWQRERGANKALFDTLKPEPTINLPLETIRVRRADGGDDVHQGQEAVAAACTDNWKSLFNPPEDAPHDDAELNAMLSRVAADAKRRLTPSQVASLMPEAMFVPENFELALDKIKADTSPGASGITTTLLKCAEWRTPMAQHLSRLALQCYRKGEMTGPMRESIISILYKGGGKPRDRCASMRPVSLTDAAYRVIDKVVEMHMNKVLTTILDGSNVGFVPGARAETDTLSMAEVARYTHAKGGGAISCLDADKAYDRVQIRRVLMPALRAFGFPEEFVGLIGILYTNLHARLKVNGHVGHAFSVANGLRQGAPSSCPLFLVVQEVFLRDLSATADFNGMIIPGTGGAGTEELRVRAYADDTKVYLASLRDALGLQKAVKRWELASGQVLSAEKLTIILLGTEIAQHATPPPELTYARLVRYGVDEADKSIGIRVGDAAQVATQWHRMLADIEQMATDCTAGRRLAGNIYARSALAKGAFVSKVYHTFLVQVPEQKVRNAIIKRLQALVNSLVFGKYSGAKNCVHQQPVRDGGIGHLDVKARLRANWTGLIMQLCQADAAPWKNIWWHAMRARYGDLATSRLVFSKCSFHLLRASTSPASPVCKLAFEGWAELPQLVPSAPPSPPPAAPGEQQPPPPPPRFTGAQVAREHIWFNVWLAGSHAALRPSTAASEREAVAWAREGLITLGDIMNGTSVIGARRAAELHPRLQTSLCNDIRVAMPKEWRAAILDGTAPTWGAACVPAGLLDDEPAIPEHMSIPIPPTLHRREPVPVSELKTRTVYDVTLARVFTLPRTFDAAQGEAARHASLYKDVPPAQLPEAVGRVVNGIRQPAVPSEICQTAYNAVHSAFPFGPNKPFCGRSTCPCGDGSPETVRHTFHECGRSKQVWEWTLQRWRLLTGEALIKFDPRVTILGDRTYTWLDDVMQSEYAQLREPWSVIHHSTLHAILLERNRDAAPRARRRRSARSLYQSAQRLVQRIIEARWAAARAAGPKAELAFRGKWVAPGFIALRGANQSVQLLFYMRSATQARWAGAREDRTANTREQEFAPPRELPNDCVSVFTDGSAIYDKNLKAWIAAGYGLAAVSGGDGPEHSGGQVEFQQCGPVRFGDDGATQLTNNVSEIQAYIHALRWARTGGGAGRPVCLRHDSKYAALVSSGVWKGKSKKNRAIVLVAQEEWKLTWEAKRGQLWIRHVKGHSDHEWNDMADALADDGRRGKIQATAGRAVD